MPATPVVLAQLTRPPSTARLVRCCERETKAAINFLTLRYGASRASLERDKRRGAALDRILSALRRLRNPEIAAYKTSRGIVVSEEFDAVDRVGQPAQFSRARELVALMYGRTPPPFLVSALAPFGECALRLAAMSGVRIMLVPACSTFIQCSPAVAALVPDIDRWQAPPAGLFVVEERSILLRSGAVRMAAAHEFAHALDSLAATKPRSYHSFENSDIRTAYAQANGFINEYAASGLDEYFAESVRAYVEVNDDRSSWLPVTRKMLQLRDPRMFQLVTNFFRTRG